MEVGMEVGMEGDVQVWKQVCRYERMQVCREARRQVGIGVSVYSRIYDETLTDPKKMDEISRNLIKFD